MLHAEVPPDELGHYTGFLLNWLGTRSRRRFVERLAPLGFHPRDLGVMQVLAARPGMTQEELAARSNVDRSSIVSLLDDLEERGLAERRVHPADRRKRCIYLTAAGEQALGELRAAADELNEELYAPLTRAERAELNVLLRKLAGLDGAPG